MDVSRLHSYDTETALFLPGCAAPPLVCASTAFANGSLVGKLHSTPQAALEKFRALLDGGHSIALANAAYDLCVMAQYDVTLLPAIFKMLREGRVHDVLIAAALDAIYYGMLGVDPKTGGDLRSPSTGKVMQRYSLELVTYTTLGRLDAKANDVWRKSYALLSGISEDRWPEMARIYPKDDAVNTLEVAMAQILGKPGEHFWLDVPSLPGATSTAKLTICKHCHHELTFGWPPQGNSVCDKAPRGEPAKNLQNLPAQVEADFAFKLGAAHGFRTDPERADKLEAEIDVKIAIAVERFQKKGWIRADGTEDDAAIKRSMAVAYGATGTCSRCSGLGTVKSVKIIECRGEKLKGRYQGCLGGVCTVCCGVGRLQKFGKDIGCKTILHDNGEVAEAGCDGTGLDLSSAPMLPRSKKLGVKTDRDAKAESGDDDLADFGEDEVNKIKSTYLPYIRRGVNGVLNPQPNVLVASGRCSYDTIHQFPRKGGVRECIRARGAWSGSPTEYYLCSSDYAAGELCSLAQVTYWYEGASKMLEVINATKDPGALHTTGAALMLGITAEDAIARLKAGDKLVKDYRQAFKCFHPDTEILTRRRGWVKISELTMDDEVASAVPHEERPAPVERVRDALGRFPPAPDGHTREWHQKNSNKVTIPSIEIVWSKPSRLTKRKATEGLLHLKNESINLRVTPDHRMLTFGSTKLLRTVEAKDFGNQRGWFNAGMCKSGDLKIDERLLRIAVAAQADGAYIVNGKIQKKIRLGFCKTRKIERLASLLQAGEYERKLYSNGKNKPTTTFILNEEFSTTIKNLLDVDKTLPWLWLELTPELRAVVLDEVAFWDSHKMAKSYHFSTTIRKNAEVLQALAAITNRKSSYTKTNEGVAPALPCDNLSVKERHYTRGENVEVTKLNYDGDVVCLTVPSDHVLVRDGGVTVITHQCAAFGYPGGLGSATLVITNRKKNAGTTTAPDGMVYAGVRFCILMGGAERCGIQKTTVWNRKACPPVCLACVKIAEEILKPSFFKSYPEVKSYLNRISAVTKKKLRIPCPAWNPTTNQGEVLRERGDCGYTDGANQAFQGLLSDIGKRAFVRMTREGYLGVKDDGSPSVLAGARFPVFLHDEPLAELPAENAHLSGPRISEIMMECGRELAPDVFWKAEPALMRYWYKSAEPVYADGKLIPWEPKVAA